MEPRYRKGKKQEILVSVPTKMPIASTNVVKGKAKNNNKSKKNKKFSPGMTNVTSLSPCTRDYIGALCNPFDGPLSCVPSSYPPIPTYKVRTFNKGFISTGTTGVGFVQFQPYGLFANNTLSVLSSITTYAGAGFPSTFPLLGVVSADTNSPYASASINTLALGIQFRVVACGVRVWYIGTEIDIQGEMFGFRHPDNETISGLSVAQVLSFSNTRRVAVDNQRRTLDVTWIPMKPQDLEFIGSFASSVFSIGIALTGAASKTNQFAYEVYGICEYVGANVPNRTPSSADPAGFAAALEAAQSTGDTWYGNARDATASLLKTAYQIAGNLSGSHVVRAAANYGMRMAVGAATGYLSGYPSLPVNENRMTIEDVGITGADHSAHSELRRGGSSVDVDPSTIVREIPSLSVMSQSSSTVPSNNSVSVRISKEEFEKIIASSIARREAHAAHLAD